MLTSKLLNTINLFFLEIIAVSGPVEQGGLSGLVPVVFEIWVIFTSSQQKKIENETKLELNM